MEQFCVDLQSQRARHGASLDQIAHATKVPQRHLLALEQGRFADLPGGIFRKGILRSYLQALAVDPTPWIPRFEACLASLELADPVLGLTEVVATVDRASAPPSVPASLSRAPFPPPATSVTASPYRWSGVVVAVVLLLAFGWFVWRFALHGRVILSSAAPSAALPASLASPPIPARLLPVALFTHLARFR